MPGQKAAEGLFPVCIEVEAKLNNPKKESFKDVAVYGFVKENIAGNSVLPNNPDFRSDAGQYAMIPAVPAGEGTVTYQFVAAVSQDPKKEQIPGLTFFNTKAISFPGTFQSTTCDILYGLLHRGLTLDYSDNLQYSQMGYTL
jgi:hypothetical protein